jgi:curved DNA-binding protein
LPHDVFRVKSHDLEIDLSITPWEAALGADIPVPTLDGPATIRLKPGTSGGQKIRLKGKGLPIKKGPDRGDLFAVIRIVLPESLSSKEKALFEELAKVSSFNPRKKI